MVTRPLRPPGRSRHERRTSPKGPRTVPTRSDQRTKTHIKEAATFLREHGKTKHAETVEGLLTPSGAAALNRLAAETATTYFPIFVTRVEEAHFRATADHANTTLSEVAEDILRRLVDGSYRPAAGVKLPYNSGAKEDGTSLNLKVPADLKEEVTRLVKDPGFVAELGWKPRGASVLLRTGLHNRFPLIPEADLPALVAAYQDGTSLTAVAARFGVAEDVASLALEFQGIPVREKDAWRAERGNTARTLSKAESAEIARRYMGPEGEEGESPYALADEYGVHFNTIYAALEREGIERRPVTVLTDEQREEIVRRARADASLTNKALAAEYGVHVNTINRVLSKAGVSRRSKS